MSFIIGTTLAYIFLDWPWRALVIAVLALIEVFEILLWLRWRGVRSVTGPEGMVGARGTALTDVVPEGRVKLKGTIWKARSASEITAGDDVVVTGVSGLELEVRRAEDHAPPTGA